MRGTLIIVEHYVVVMCACGACAYVYAYVCAYVCAYVRACACVCVCAGVCILSAAAAAAAIGKRQNLWKRPIKATPTCLKKNQFL
jgi:hypothetical protein